MFTQCPKCQSVFMVSDKDIKAHEGLVRCGNCYSVFNSSWNLTDDPRSENDIGEAPASDSGSQPASRGSGFTFSILGSDTDAVAADENVADQPEGIAEPGIKESKSAVEYSDQPADDFLEPFPEPGAEDDLKPVPIAEEDKKISDSLLYFDSDEEADNNNDVIENASIMKMPSLNDDGELLDLDEPQLEADISESESALLSMTEDSMWPGSELSFENGGEFDLPVLENEQTDAEPSPPDAAETLPDLPDIILDDADDENDLVEGLSDPFHFNEPADLAEDSLPDMVVDNEEVAGEEGAGEEKEPPEPYLSAQEDEGEIAEFGEDDIPDTSTSTDDTIIADSEYSEGDEGDELITVESLPDSADEASSLDAEEDDPADSVFITSEEEELGDAYVPITVKHDERDELFHGLDEFPEPGELSQLNYEDTMEINAMLEAANISKEQIDSAISSEGGDDDEIVEEIMLSSDADVDLSEAIFIPPGDDDAEPGADPESTNAKSGVSFFKNMLPLGWGDKKPLTEPAVLGPDETQLIQNLHRRKNKSELPEWITKYSLIAANVVLVLALLGQIGYFYMDKLVRITPIRPLLEVGCMVAGCTVPTIQNTQDIKQLSSRLTPLEGGDGGFKVDSILVNRGIRLQGFPALELTLTDRAGNMISRRVVTPDKYLPAGQSTEMKPNAAADVSIRFRTPSIRVDGFELRPVSQSWLER